MDPDAADSDYMPPPSRGEVLGTCPGLEASPTQVRDWLATYLVYRGLDAAGADGFFWRGAELHRASYPTLFDAFKNHCGLLDWEAELLAYDIYTVLEDSIPPPSKTLFQKYVENVFGYEFYSSLLQWKKPNPGFLDRANCVFCWIGFLVIHIVFFGIFRIVSKFIMFNG
ncbi:hypothetical protein GGR56DRAFT_675731 [Xylariaceae sp. FL0804]|nr:hypothetical protein GGR56DRAFT_675731 [Xylariaceae sp. FL0804]